MLILTKIATRFGSLIESQYNINMTRDFQTEGDSRIWGLWGIRNHKTSISVFVPVFYI